MLPKPFAYAPLLHCLFLLCSFKEFMRQYCSIAHIRERRLAIIIIVLTHAGVTADARHLCILQLFFLRHL